jgi:hypothetical protein
MKVLNFMSLILLAALFLTSCDKDLEVEDSPRENFELLWKTIDERYCFFEHKKDSIKDWNDVYDEYSPMIHDDMSQYDLFNVLGSMLNELKDGHVNLVSAFDVSRYDLQGDYPFNFDINVLEGSRYLGKDYKKAGGILYKRLSDDVGYMYYSSFSNSFNDSNLNHILYHFKDTKGIIIDIRNNGGGAATNVEALADRFVDEKLVVGYWQYKTGKAHGALSVPRKIYLEPDVDNLRYLRKVVVLTNRGCYSAANDFVQTMKGLPNVKIVGDRTGGGAGMPVSSELPNGWSVRFSTAPYMDKDMKYTEFGIEPDVYVDMSKDDAERGIDSIIELACRMIAEE